MTNKEKRDEQLEDVRWVMDSPRGRRFIRRLIGEVCCVYATVMRDQPGLLPQERLAYNAGKQDVGHFLMDECSTAHPVGMQQMNQEAYAVKIQGETPMKKPQEETQS